MGRFFGTDGVRGIANVELTNDLAYKLGRYGAHVLTEGRKHVKILIGKDGVFKYKLYQNTWRFSFPIGIFNSIFY